MLQRNNTMSSTITNQNDLHIIEPNQPAIGSVIWLHGLGADNRNFDTLVPELTQQGQLPLRFIFPNAPVRPVTINQQFPTRAWYDVYSLTHLDEEDEPGIAASQATIEKLIVTENGRGISSDKIILAGFSQGGAMALHTGLRYKDKLAGILGLSCYLPLFHQINSHATDINKNTPIFIAHGTDDDILSVSNAKITHSVLDHTHTNVAWHEYPMMHEINLQEVYDIQHWLASIYRS